MLDSNEENKNQYVSIDQDIPKAKRQSERVRDSQRFAISSINFL